ncbi:MAG: hypothetical protein H7Y04_09370 [Verrucomicrobia bacterium]|nr:hypothetical protein [Cytophagales bacterium]
MYEKLGKYLTIILSSAVKFIFGPVEGLALGLTWVETAVFTVCGMMVSVVVFTFFGEFMKEKLTNRFFKQKKLFTPKTRRNVKLWQKYGIYGVAFLTPLLLTPIGGTILATSFGEKKLKIFFWMLISGIFWCLVFTLLIFQAQDFLRKLGLHF